MILFFIIAMSFLAMGIDLYLFLRITKSCRFRPWQKVLYLTITVLVDLLVVVALSTYRYASKLESADVMLVCIWLIWLFFLNLAPKMIFAFFNIIGRIAGYKKSVINDIFNIVGGVFAILLIVTMIYGATYGRSAIEVRNVTISSDKLPQSFDGLRIVQFSDLHIGNLINRDKAVANMVSTINSLDPDIVVQSGDIVNITSQELNHELMCELSQIKSRYGVFAVFGNHDLGFYIPPTSSFPAAVSVPELIEKQREMGWNFLNNQTQFIGNGLDSIAISGLGFPNEYAQKGSNSQFSGADTKSTFENVATTTFNILISHTPRVWYDPIFSIPSDLTLSGHVHSMQMKIKIGDWQFSPAKYRFKNWSGLYEKGGKWLYVNDGMGYVMYPMRIGTRPEITLITLRSTKKEVK